MKVILDLKELKVGDVLLMVVFDTHNYAVGDKYGWDGQTVEVVRERYLEDSNIPHTRQLYFIDVVPLGDSEVDYRIPTQLHSWHAHPEHSGDNFSPAWQITQCRPDLTATTGYYFEYEPNERDSEYVHLLLLQHTHPMNVEQVGEQNWAMQSAIDEDIELEDVEIR